MYLYMLICFPTTLTISILFHCDRYLNSIDRQIEEAFLENEIPCLDDQYQKYQKRPQRHTVINVQIGFLGVYSLSTSNMDLKADLYLYQKWSDIILSNGAPINSNVSILRARRVDRNPTTRTNYTSTSSSKSTYFHHPTNIVKSTLRSKYSSTFRNNF